MMMMMMMRISLMRGYAESPMESHYVMYCENETSTKEEKKEDDGFTTKWNTEERRRRRINRFNNNNNNRNKENVVTISISIQKRIIYNPSVCINE